MNKQLRHIVVIALLINYMLLGVIGHFETLYALYSSSKPQTIVQAKSAVPPITKLYWTQHKHIPSVIKISVPTPTIQTPLEIDKELCFSKFVLFETESNYLNPDFCFISSRAPPIL